MPLKVTGRNDLRIRLAAVGMATARRDLALVAGESNATRSMDRVYALNTASRFDELLHSIRENGPWQLLLGMDPQNRKGALYPFV